MKKFSVQPLLCLLLGWLVDFSFAQHVVTVAEKNGGFGKLVTLLDSANSVKQQLVTGRDFTFFGPSDVALASAELTGPVGQLDDEILKSHVVTGVYSAADLLNAGDCMILDTLSTSMPKIKITIMDHGDQKMILVNNVHVIVPDVVADNGIFHGVDGVILPNSFTPCKTEAPTLSPDTATSLSTLSHFAAMVAVSATLLLAL